LLTFGATFILSCAAIGRFLPFPDVPVVRTKFAHFAAHRDDYDTLFLGSSHFYYQVIPSVFDTLTAGSEHPTRSFNAGFAGLRPRVPALALCTTMLTPPANSPTVTS
jgi:hypothetical protein